MRSKWAALLCLASVTLSPVLPAMAQEVFVPYEDAGTATYDGSAVYTGATPVGNAGGYLFFRKDFDNAVGYDDGYSSVGWFQPFEILGANGFFGQGQIFVTDDGEVGGSLNAGWRTFVDSQNRVYGAYGGIDFDESARGNRYEQVTLGIETLGQMWDFRLNGYFPLDNDSSFEGLRSLGGGPPVFQGNNLVVFGTAFFEKPMPGADVEWGFPLLDPSGFGRLRSYFGGYVYDSEDTNPAGVRVRLESHVNEHVTLGAAFFHDDVNGGMATASLDIRGWSRSLPGLNNKTPSNEAKLYLPIVRNYRVAAETYVENFSTPALDAGGNALDFVWVDNSNPNAGDGTFENPFQDMPGNAPGADYVLVWRGDSSEANPVLGGIALEDGQRLYGEGFRFSIAVAGHAFGPAPGVFDIDDLVPTWSITGDGPFLSNPGGDVITLANDNHVRSFQIISSGGHGITGAGIDNFLLEDLIIGNDNPGLGNAGAGIFLTNASGVGTINNFSLLNNAGGGLRIQNTGAADLDLVANLNTSLTPNVTGGDVGLELTADGSNIQALLTDFFNDGSGTGALLQALNGSNLVVEIDEGSFDNTTVGDGIQVVGTGGSTIDLDLTNVTANNATGHGLNINLDNTQFSGIFDSSVGDTFSDAGANGITLIANNSPSLANELRFTQTTVDRSGNDGLHIELTSASFFNVSFQNGSIQGSGGDAVDESVTGGSTLNLLVNPSLLTDSGENGLLFFASGAGSTINNTFLDTDLSRSGFNGISGLVELGATVDLAFDGSIATNSGLNGMIVVVNSGGALTGDFLDGDFSDSELDGINIAVDGAGSTADLFLANTPADNTPAANAQDRGFVYNVTAGGDLFAFIDGGSFSGNLLDGVVGAVDGATSVANVLLDGTLVDNNGDDGFELSATNSGEHNLSLLAGSASDNAGNGMLLTANTDGDLSVSVEDGSAVDGNGLAGIVGTTTDLGSTLDVAVIESTVDGNLGGSGIDLSATVDGTLNAFLVDGSASGNTGDGVRINVDGTAATAPTATMTVDGFAADANDESGYDIAVLGGGQLTADFTGFTGPSSASNNGDDGFTLLVDGTGTLADFTTFGDLTANNNGLLGAPATGHGFNITVANDAELNMTGAGGLTGNNNQLDGFHLTATGGATIANVTLSGDNQFDNNGLAGDLTHGYGVHVEASGIAELTAVTGGGSNNALGGVLMNADTVALIHNIGVDGGLLGTAASNNQGNGIEINLTNNTTIENVTVNNAAVADNTGLGVVIFADNNTQIDNILVSNNLISGSQGGDGLLFELIDSPVTTLIVDGNGSSNNAGHGINFELDNSTIADLQITGNDQGTTAAAGTLDVDWNNLIWTTFLNNNSTAGFDIAQFILDISPTGQGWRPDLTPFTQQQFQPQNATDVTVGLTAVNGNLITAGTDPLEDQFGFFLPDGGVPVESQILVLDFDDFQTGEQLEYNLAHALLGDNSILGGNTLAGSIATVVLEDGRSASGVLGPGGLNLVQVFGSISPGISGNTGDGIRINQTNGSDIAAMLIDDNFIDSNGQHGIEFLVSNSTLPDGTVNPAAVISNNVITNHAAGDGVNLILPNTGGVDIAMNFENNDISNNVTGINVELDGNAGEFISNSLTNTVDSNDSFGLRLVAGPGSAFDVNFDGGSFSENGDAGVGVSMNGIGALGSVGHLGIQNATISNNVNGPDLNFAGQGIHVRMLEDATLLSTSFISGNELNGNQVAAIDFHVQDNATVEGGLTIDGNIISESGDGIRFTRTSNGSVGSIGNPVLILNNEITGGADGIELIARNAAFTDTYSLSGNDIINVGGRGVVLEHGFDASLRVDMVDNFIDGSGSHGIHAFQTPGTLAIELRRLTGTWSQNIVTNNGGDGMFLEARLGSGVALVVTDNIVSDNEGQGIDVTGPGIADFTFNTVESNDGGGIYVTGNGFKDMVFNNNEIRSNTGDGFRLVNNGNSGLFGFTIQASGNDVEFNTERGMNILNQGTADTTLVMNNNFVNLNAREGVYVMNSASTNQSAAFGAAILTDGSPTAIPRLNLTFSGNAVGGNGNAGTTVATGGFVLRVGTSDGSDSFTDPGGFAATRGGVVATMDGNTFVGNAGNDVYFDSFVSTIPPVTGGTWTDQNDNPRNDGNNEFNPTGFRADPLARLDLVFTNNTGDERAFTNTGAAYTTNEAVFKSRTQGQDGNDPAPPDDNGPFGSGTRARNAQRLAGRFGLPPTIPQGSTFLFSGIGQSTFRVQESGNVFTVGTNFIFDVDPYASPADANGVGATGGGPSGIDNMPFGWSVLP